MVYLNGITTSLFDWLLAPFERFGPPTALLIWSVIIGVLAAVVFRYTSNQQALRAAADQVRASLLAIKLFQDDLGVTLRCQLELLAAIARRLWHSLPPLAVMIVPMVLILTQVGLRFEHVPLRSGEATVVQLRFSPDAWQRYRDVSIQVSDGATVETPALRDDDEHTVYWRVSSVEPKPFEVSWQLDDRLIAKRVEVTESIETLQPVSVQRPGTSWFDQLLHPAEQPFSAQSPVMAILVQHERRSTPIFGWDLPWWLTFLIVSCVAAWLMRPLIKIQF
jgi:hypothetical protein